MSHFKDRIFSAFRIIWLIIYESLQRIVYFTPKGPYILSHLCNFLLLGMDRIFFDDDRIFSEKTVYFQQRTVYFQQKTVYFQARTVYFPAGPYIFKDRIFYFSGPYILPYNRSRILSGQDRIFLVKRLFFRTIYFQGPYSLAA